MIRDWAEWRGTLAALSSQMETQLATINLAPPGSWPKEAAVHLTIAKSIIDQQLRKGGN